MSHPDRVRPNDEEVASSVVDGEAIFINLSTGVYYSLRGAGPRCGRSSPRATPSRVATRADRRPRRRDASPGGRRRPGAGRAPGRGAPGVARGAGAPPSPRTSSWRRGGSCPTRRPCWRRTATWLISSRSTRRCRVSARSPGATGRGDAGARRPWLRDGSLGALGRNRARAFGRDRVPGGRPRCPHRRHRPGPGRSLLPALAHLRVDDGSGAPDLSVSIWDESVVVPGRPGFAPDDEGATRPLPASPHRRRFVRSTPAEMLWLDLDARSLAGWFASAAAVPPTERAKPLAGLLAPWLREHGRQIVHAAMVVDGAAGVLVAGRGGAGKSTVALAAGLAGLGYVGDDLVALEEARARASSGTACTRPASSDARTSSASRGSRPRPATFSIRRGTRSCCSSRTRCPAGPCGPRP